VVRDVAWSPDGSGEFEDAMEEVAVAATAAAAR
jgi:hypothetical protein